jgi:hypothetical protein
LTAKAAKAAEQSFWRATCARAIPEVEILKVLGALGGLGGHLGAGESNQLKWIRR